MKIEEKLKELEGWSLIDGQLVREFIFDSFLDGINFIEKVSEIAEEQNPLLSKRQLYLSHFFKKGSF